jgi:hypothetical protein
MIPSSTKVTLEFLDDVELLLAHVKSTVAASNDFELQNAVKRINDVLGAKYEALIKRNAFTQYKTAAPMSAEREIARTGYLDLVGMHRDWRSAKEVSP